MAPADGRVVGVGIDLIEMERVAAALGRWGERLVDRLMGSQEQALLRNEGLDLVLSIARRIAVKEAASKALGTGWTRGVSWRHVVVSLLPEPTLTLESQAAEVARGLGSPGRALVHTRETGGGLAYAEVILLA